MQIGDSSDLSHRWPTAGRLLANCRSSVGRPTGNRQLTKGEINPTQNINYSLMP